MAIAARDEAMRAFARVTLSARTAGAGVTVLATLVAPLLVPSVYRNVASRAIIFGVVGLSINVLIGYTGQVSLGHAAFVGIGAFAAGYAQTEMAMPFPVALVFAGCTGAAAAIVLGGVALRVRGLYLALVTLAYGIFAQEVVFNIRTLTGGGGGMPAPRPGFASSDIAYVYVCLAMLALAIAFDRRFTASRAGRAIQALRDDERVAASWGVNVTAYKLLAFVISGAIAGIAGGLFASVEQIVAPLDFAFTLSLTFLLMAVVGGVGSRGGAVQAGIFVAALPTLLDASSRNIPFPPFNVINASFAPLVVALLVLVGFVFFPGGIAQVEAAIAVRARRAPSQEKG